MSEGFGRESMLREAKPLLEREPAEYSPELKKIKRELTLLIPEDFKLTQQKLQEALETIQLRHREKDSLEALMKTHNYEGEPIYPTPIHIRAQEIIGTENPSGWAGLVEGIGREEKPKGHTREYTMAQTLEYAQRIIEMEPGARNQVIDGVGLAMIGGGYGRQFFVDESGRHTVFLLKGLAEMGCTVMISGMKVAHLVRK